MPGIFWALLVDILDIVLFGVGLIAVFILKIFGDAFIIDLLFMATLNVLFTLFQSVVIFLIFEEPKMLFGALEATYEAIPLADKLLDYIPSFTIVYILISMGYL